VGPGWPVTCRENHWLETASWSHRLVTRRSGKTEGLIAPRDPPRNGTQTTSTRSAGAAIPLKMLLCTQLAPARPVAQVGEKIRTGRGCPLWGLTSDFSVEIWSGDMTPPLRAAAPWPAGGGACVHDARARLTAAAATTRAGHDLSRSRQATPIPIRFP